MWCAYLCVAWMPLNQYKMINSTKLAQNFLLQMTLKMFSISLSVTESLDYIINWTFYNIYIMSILHFWTSIGLLLY